MNDTSTCLGWMFARMLVCSCVLLGACASQAYAQPDAPIYTDSTAQTIRGFGAAYITGWRPDMTDAEIEAAFGMGEGQLGFSILRLRIPPQKNQWANQVATAQKAHSMGATIVASPWSPPADMKTNSSIVGGRLRDEMYDDYAAHLDSFVTFMANNGVPIYAVSVQNEPDVEVGYESCDWTPEEMVRFMSEHADAIGTRVMAPESFQFRRQMSDPILNDPEAVENLDIVAGHIYGGGLGPYPLAEEKGKEVWMTEYLLNLGTGNAGNPPWNSYSESEIWEETMEMLNTIQTSMSSNMNAYIWWYLARYYSFLGDGTEGTSTGEVLKRGYAFSHFSKFIRPGYTRIHADSPVARGYNRVSVTAYKDSVKTVIVAINGEGSSKDVHFVIENGMAGTFNRYVTSVTQNVEQVDDVELSGNGFTTTLPAQSITTFVSDDLAVSNEEVVPSPSYRLMQNYPNPFSSATAIGYTVPRAGEVTLEVFDLLGRRVATLVDGRVAAGSHQVAFQASHLPSGVYVYQLRTGDVVQTRRMTVIK